MTHFASLGAIGCATLFYMAGNWPAAVLFDFAAAVFFAVETETT